MHEVKTTILRNLKTVDDFRKQVEEGQNDGYFMLYFDKKQNGYVSYDVGNASLYEWVGMLEFAKSMVLDLLHEESEED